MAFPFSLRALCAAALLASPALPALASNASPSPSPSPTAPPEIAHVVTSDRIDETLGNATRTTYVITHEEIVRRGYRTVADALADVPGVEIASYGPIGSLVNFGIRGSSSKQTLVLIDGLPAPGELGGTVELGTLSTQGIRRIEVVEGGGSTLYGTGAIGGIINVITETNAPASASLRWGTFGDRTLRASGGGFSLERIVANNAFSVPANVPATIENNYYDATAVRYGGTRRAGALDVTLSAGLTSDRIGVPGELGFASPTSRENDVNGDSSLTFALRRPQSDATLQLGGSRQQILFSCSGGSSVNCFQSAPSLDAESRLDLGLRNAVSGANERLIYGIDLSRGDVREDDGSGDISTNALAQSAAYMQENVATQAGDIYAGLRGERDGAFGGELSPSLGFRRVLGSGFVFRANAATAFRAPNASELYFPFFGNPSLVPERAKVGDASLEDRSLLGGVSIGWFTNDSRNLIIDDPTNDYLPENVGHAHLSGFTLDAQTLPYHGVTTGLEITDLYEASNLDAGTRLPNDPVLSVGLRLGLRGRENSLFDDAGIAVRTVGASQPLDATQPYFANAIGYTTIDAFARLRVGKRALLALRGYNLGNERYAQVTGYPMPGRRLAIELSTR
jgi:vitamin B12 transporter